MNTIEQFAHRAAEGSAECTLLITDVGTLHSSLVESLKAHGHSDDITALIDEKLLGVCPKCATVSSGNGLANLSVQKFIAANAAPGAAFVFSSSSERSKRLFEGHCHNPECDSKEITVYFRPDADTAMANALERRGINIVRSGAALNDLRSRQSAPDTPVVQWAFVFNSKSRDAANAIGLLTQCVTTVSFASLGEGQVKFDDLGDVNNWTEDYKSGKESSAYLVLGMLLASGRRLSEKDHYNHMCNLSNIHAMEERLRSSECCFDRTKDGNRVVFGICNEAHYALILDKTIAPEEYRYNDESLAQLFADIDAPTNSANAVIMQKLREAGYNLETLVSRLQSEPPKAGTVRPAAKAGCALILATIIGVAAISSVVVITIAMSAFY